MTKREKAYFQMLVSNANRQIKEIFNGELYSFMTAEQKEGYIKGISAGIESIAIYVGMKVASVNLNSMKRMLNYQIVKEMEEDGRYYPGYDQLIANASSDEEVSFLEELKEERKGFVYNMVYVGCMTCGHYEIFQTHINDHHLLSRMLEERRDYIEKHRCSGCIGGWR